MKRKTTEFFDISVVLCYTEICAIAYILHFASEDRCLGSAIEVNGS